jgi:hypothetical protein
MIIKNSAKCNACGVEIESKSRHHFNVHYCKKEPGEDWKFAVDGGKSYLRRCGTGYTETSVVENDAA